MRKIEKIRENQPLFWMNETSGMMKQIGKKFFGKKVLNPSELKVIKEYIIQWVDNTVNSMKFLISEEEYKNYLKTGVPKDYKKKIEDLKQKEIMNYVTEELLSYGLDPF